MKSNKTVGMDIVNFDKLDIADETASNLIGLLSATTAGAIAVSRSGQTCKKPVIEESFINRSNWNAYRACLAREEQKRKDELAEAERQRQFELEQAKIKAEQKKIESQTQQQRDVLISQGLALKQQQRQAEQSGKFLGMPIGVAIALGVVLLGGISFGIYKLVKK
jgi:hypothetical protein